MRKMMVRILVLCCLGSNAQNPAIVKAFNGNAAGANPYTLTRSGITGFSPSGILNSGATVPLRSLSFQAKICNVSNIRILYDLKINILCIQ